MMQPAAQAQPQSNQNMMAFLQAMQQARQQAQPPQQPQMPPQSMPPQGGAPMMQPRPPMPQMPPQGGMPQGGAPMPPQGAGQPQMPMQGGMPPQGAPRPTMPQQQPQQGGQPNPQQMQAIVQLLAGMGRGGDSLMAHLTPGEVAVPPEVQTPKLLADLRKAFESKGVSPAQFVAGSPQSSHNPESGAPEYNFMSAFLPAAAGIAGSIAMPYLAPEIGSALLTSSVGAGLGTAAGGLAAGQTPTQAALSGVGAGAGGYALGSLGGAAGQAAGGGSGAGNLPITGAGGPTVANANAAMAPSVAQNFASNPGGIMPAGTSLGAPAASAASGGAGGAAATAGQPGISNLWGNLPDNSINPMRSIGSTVGGYIGNKLGAPPKPTTPNYPPGFNTPMTPVSQLPSAQTQLGQNTTKMAAPNFTGYNPATNNPAAFNFFPTATSGA